MRSRTALLFLLLTALAGCVAAPLRPELRPDLDRQWRDPVGKITWPINDGFAGTPVLVVLPPRVLLDRFGAEETGRFFRPKGASFSARALPYACTNPTYATYRVLAPLPVWAGKAAPWFGERGGATQFQTDAAAASLLADGTLERVPHREPAPCG
jgi:hypothetical protein